MRRAAVWVEHCITVEITGAREMGNLRKISLDGD